MAKSPTYISDFIQSNFIDKFNKNTNISFYRKHLSNNNNHILNENETKITLKASSTSKIDDYASSEATSIIFNEDREKTEYSRKNVYEDFKESMATIASKRRVSSDKLLSQTLSQNGSQKFSPSETPLTNFYKNAVTSCKLENKNSFLEKNNNLKKMNRKFNLKINIEAKEAKDKENFEKNQKNLFSLRENQENTKLCSYIKTEPCKNSKKDSVNLEESGHQLKNLPKQKKKNRVNKIYSMQSTINDHLKSKLDHKSGSNIGTTEEEFESEEISEGNIIMDENKRIERMDISEGIVYGKGGIPINQTFKNKDEYFSYENKENFQKRQNEQSRIKNNFLQQKQKKCQEKNPVTKKLEGIVENFSFENKDVGLLKKKLKEYAAKNILRLTNNATFLHLKTSPFNHYEDRK